jgi:nicotinate-nucleotide adenylyltransferase
MKIGLFFGSFNPVHVGHMILANYMLEYTDLESIRFVTSPQNPLKDKDSLLSESERLKMVNMALVDNEKMQASDVEFKMPKPSYTIDTLEVLKKRSPENEYVIIMGTDNLENLHKWKDYEKILEQYEIYVYSRSTSEGGELRNHLKVKLFDAHLVEMSSTFVRQAIKENRDVRYLVPTPVWNYIKRKGFYK